MKKLFCLVMLAICFSWLIGCAITPINPSDATLVPSERVYAFQGKTPARTSTLVVTRDEGISGSGASLDLFINGFFAACFEVSETARFYVEPGEIVLGVSSPLAGITVKRETTLKPNEVKYFRLLLYPGGFDIQRSDFTKEKWEGAK